MKRSALIGWGVGSFTSASLVSAIGLLHLRFMTDSLGLSIALAGFLVVISRVYDTILDPIVGMISDRTRTRYGRYRPYLVVGGLLAALSMVLLFNVPTSLSGGGLVAFVVASLILFSTAYTLFRIPYLALGRAITQDFAERSKLMTFSVYGSSLGSLAATSLAPFLLSQIGSDRAGHGVIAWILAALIAAGGISTFLLIGEERTDVTPATRAKHSLRETARALGDNKPFRCLIGFKVVLFTGLSVHINAIPYYTRHVLGATDLSLGSVFLTQTIMMVATQFLWVRLAGRVGRRNALLTAGIIEIFVMLCWLLIPVGHPTPWLQICGGLSGVASGGLFFGLYTVLTDTMDYTRRRTGDGGREGILAGVFVMVEKATTAAGTFIFSSILGWVGYISAHDAGAAAQPATVTTGIIFALAIVPSCCAMVACLFLRGMKLDDDASGRRSAPSAPDAITDEPSLRVAPAG